LSLLLLGFLLLLIRFKGQRLLLGLLLLVQTRHSVPIVIYEIDGKFKFEINKSMESLNLMN
jgi:hypothetical protein